MHYTKRNANHHRLLNTDTQTQCYWLGTYQHAYCAVIYPLEWVRQYWQRWGEFKSCIKMHTDFCTIY